MLSGMTCLTLIAWLCAADGDLGFNGHPTTVTPNIDKLAFNGKVLSSWYSGCPV